MDPSQLMVQFFSLPTVMFVLGLGAIVSGVRRASQALFPSLPDKTWWKEIVLPVAPPLLGVLVAYIASAYPYPEIFAKTTSARLFFGLVCGFFSSKIYRLGWAVLKKQLKDKGVDVSNLESVRPTKGTPTIPPPAPPS